jgi:FemAB-related protein (PEP-CTERM system-associated)
MVARISPFPNRMELSEIAVKRLELADHPRWDRFAESAIDGTFFHLAGWHDVIEKAFGHQTFYLYTEKRGEITGILPLGLIRSRLFGNALISTPFCVYGGAIANSPAERQSLEDAAERLAVSLGVDYLEVRGRAKAVHDWPTKDLYVTFRKEIAPDPDTNLKAIPRKQRAMVRKGIKAGLTSEIDTDLDRFFAMYSSSVRNLGTPVFARRYFELLKSTFGDRCELLTVTSRGTPVSSVMSFYFRDEVLPYYGGGAAEARDLKANDFMYWELMRRAAERGIRIFDYGRSKEGTGSYSFKKNWGFEPEPLPYAYRLVRAREMPNINPLNPKYRLFVGLWKRLPLGLANRLGPFLSRSLG